MRVLLLVLVLGLVGCGGVATTTAPPARYTAQDAARVWHDHGLPVTLAPNGGTPPSGFTETWLVSPAQFGGTKAMMLWVAESPAAAQNYVEHGGGGPFMARRWRQGNLVLLYADDTAQPYITALGDLR